MTATPEENVVSMMLSAMRSMRATIEELHKSVDVCVDETRAARAEILALRNEANPKRLP